MPYEMEHERKSRPEPQISMKFRNEFCEILTWAKLPGMSNMSSLAPLAMGPRVGHMRSSILQPTGPLSANLLVVHGRSGSGRRVAASAAEAAPASASAAALAAAESAAGAARSLALPRLGRVLL